MQSVVPNCMVCLLQTYLAFVDQITFTANAGFIRSPYRAELDIYHFKMINIKVTTKVIKREKKQCYYEIIIYFSRSHLT